MLCEYSKNSLIEMFFEHPKQMFKLIDKKIISKYAKNFADFCRIAVAMYHTHISLVVIFYFTNSTCSHILFHQLHM